MNRKTIVLFGLLFIIFSLVSCSNRDRKISVSGIGIVTFIPDMVEISIVIKNTNPRLNDSLIQTKDTVVNIISICKKYNIAEIDIKTSYINTDKEYFSEKYNTELKFIGYSATQTTQIKFRDLKQFEKLSEELLALKITSIDGIIFDHSQKSDYSSEADLLALDDAKLSASKIAERMGVKLGKVLSISNLNEQVGTSRYSQEMISFSKSIRSGIVISPGILSISKNINVVFEIQ